MAEATESWAVTLAVRYGDVFEEICGHLGFVDLIKLGLACRAFDEIIDPRDMMRRRGCLREEMREVDLQEHPSGDLACYYCTRMRPKNLFTHGQSRDKFASRKGRYQTAAMTRICVECAVPMRFYRHLAPVKFRGERHLLCHRCGLFAPEPRCCGRIAIVREDGVRVIPVICYFELRDPWNPLSSLEKMPREVMRRIARHLDYDDAINLGMVSQWMYRKVKPAEMVPIHERYRFTNKLFLRQEPCAWSEDEFGLPSGRLPSCRMLPCFVCFRIRDIKHFTVKQIEMSSVDPIEAWRMRCKSCLQKLYVERDSVLLARYRSYEMCQGCFILKDKEKDCFYCAEWRRAGIIKGPKPRRDGFHVGSFDSRREHSFLTEATFPLRKHGTTLEVGNLAWELGTAQLGHHGWL